VIGAVSYRIEVSTAKDSGYIRIPDVITESEQTRHMTGNFDGYWHVVSIDKDGNETISQPFRLTASVPSS
jgi:hypothetical protein